MYFEVLRADTPALLDRVYRLRHQERSFGLRVETGLDAAQRTSALSSELVARDTRLVALYPAGGIRLSVLSAAG